MICRAVFVVVCASALQGQSTDPQERFKQAIADHQAGKLDAAIAEYRVLLAAYPQAAQIRSNLGAALSSQGKYLEAITEYKAALEAEPNPQVRLNLALAYYKANEYPEAIDQLKTIVKTAPAITQALLLLADCYLTTGEYKSVIDLLTPLENQSDPAITYLLGTALVRNGQADRGQVIINRILKNGASAEASLLIGTTKLQVSDFAGAVVDLKAAVEANPDLPDVYAYYGMALLASGDQSGAQQAFAKELERNPNNFDANLRMGVLERQDQNLDEAAKYFNHAALVRPGDPGVRFQLSSLALAQGRLDEARTSLEAILKESPNFVEAHVTLATVYYRLKRKADGDAQRAIADRELAEKQAKEPGAAKPTQ